MLKYSRLLTRCSVYARRTAVRDDPYNFTSFSPTGSHAVLLQKRSFSDTGTLTESLSKIQEPAFVDMGLASAWPSGQLQSALEFIYLNTDVTWSGAIVATTVFIRLVTFPLGVKAKLIGLRTKKHAPEVTRLTKAIREPGIPPSEMAQRIDAFQKFQDAKEIGPRHVLPPMLCNGVVMASMFFGLRGMAEAPVESMKAGGLYWFTDLTVCDPTFCLPILTTATLFVNIYTGAEVTVEHEHLRKFMLAMPFLSLPFMCYFPAALNLYWFTSNLFSLGQNQFLRLRPVKDFFNLHEEEVPASEVVKSQKSDPKSATSRTEPNQDTEGGQVAEMKRQNRDEHENSMQKKAAN